MKIPAAQYGDILCVNSAGLADAAIRWWTDSTVNHVACCIGNNEIIDATPFRGVRRRSIMEESEGNTWQLLRLKAQFNSMLSPGREKLSATWLAAQQGKGYDYLGIFGFPLDKDIHDSHRYVCSRLAYVWQLKRGIPVIERTPAGLVSPQGVFGSSLFEIIDEHRN